MSTNTIKQPSIQRLFIQLLQTNRLQHAYLFEGKMGTGKKDMAKYVAKGLFCIEQTGEPCQNCHACNRIETKQHPDVVEVEPDGQSIKIGQIRELKEAFTKSGMESRKKIVIVEDVEKMTNQAANSLLKFLEEPDGDILVILLTTARHRLLPTILSRCQLIHFPQLSKKMQRENLEAAGLSEDRAALLSQLTADTTEALELAENDTLKELIPVVWKWFSFIFKKDGQSFVFVHTDIMPLVKDKKDHMRTLDLLLILLQDILNSQVSEDYAVAYLKHKSAIQKMADSVSIVSLAHMMEHVLTAKKQLESNVAAQGVFEDCTLQLMTIMTDEH